LSRQRLVAAEAEALARAAPPEADLLAAGLLEQDLEDQAAGLLVARLLRESALAERPVEADAVVLAADLPGERLVDPAAEAEQPQPMRSSIRRTARFLTHPKLVRSPMT
jgi:hypothetical protein